MTSPLKGRYLSESDFQKFIDFIPELDMYKKKTSRIILTLEDTVILYKLMYYCALKVKEVLNLKKEDFNLDQKLLNLKNVNTPIKQTTIPPFLVSELKDFLENKGESKKLFEITHTAISQKTKKIGEMAKLKIFKTTEKQEVKGVHTLVFRQSYEQFMLQNNSGSDLSNLKLRFATATNYNDKKIEDLLDWESKFEFTLTYGVVILGDILGTKGMWREKISRDVIANWSWLVEKTTESLERRFNKPNVKVRAFSDTVLITCTGGDTKDTVAKVGAFLKEFISICIVYDFPIRGVFSLGQFVDSEQMIIGPAIDEAASFYEQSNWIGFSATPSTFSIIEKLEKSSRYKTSVKKYFIKYDVPMKNTAPDKQNWAIQIDPDYLITSSSAKNFTKKSDFLDMSIRDIVDYKLEHPSGAESGIKWKNLLLFLDHVSENP